jgi:hypothetical protein
VSKRAGVELRGQDQRALLVGRVDEAMERLGFVGTGGQQTDVINDDKIRADDPLDGLAGRGVDPGARDRRGQRFEGEPADPEIAFDRADGCGASGGR